MLEEFYNNLTAVGVSAVTGEGLGDFLRALDTAADEYERTYGEEMRQRRGASAEAKPPQAAASQAASGQGAASRGEGRTAAHAAGATVVPDAQGEEDSLAMEAEEQESLRQYLHMQEVMKQAAAPAGEQRSQ